MYELKNISLLPLVLSDGRRIMPGDLFIIDHVDSFIRAKMEEGLVKIVNMVKTGGPPDISDKILIEEEVTVSWQQAKQTDSP